MAKHSKKLLLALAPFFLFAIADWLFPLPTEKLYPPSSTVVLDRDGRMLRAFLAPDQMWRIRVSANEISPSLKTAAIAYEDKYFYWHFGINPFSVTRAAIANLRAGKIVRGGSTLTMQVARMMEPKERTFLNKLKEAFRAAQLEVHYSKEEILTLYFNRAPYGGNIVGVGAAAYFYFNKSAPQLSLGEAALLAAIPNSPNLLRPDFNPAAAQKARDKVLRLLARAGRITPQRCDEARSEALPEKRYALPFMVPHLAAKLSQVYPQTERLETTIDGNIQSLAQTILQTQLRPWRGQGIGNGAVVVIDNQSQSVLALVGSYDFFDEANAGQVNGALAPRSPGSALKPFIYALGLEHGVITPQSLLDDVPVDYAGYQPVNYDEKYHGAVTVEEALIHSLNVPAVNLYARLGEKGIYEFLKEAGISTLPHDKNYYGLSLILGGCEVTLLELTNLYAGLANAGSFRPYRLLQDQPPAEGKRLFSAGTSFILTEMLSKLRRPDLPKVWETSINLPKVAWKTGTSYGHRDAWSLGYTPQYTIGVWVGNFDGRGAPALVGAETAAPILFALFEALAKPSENRWFVQPEIVERRQVCSVSGMPAAEFCVSRKDELFLPGVSPQYPCTIHRLVWLDRKTGQRLCAHCRIGRAYVEKIFEHWPPEIATWMKRNGYPIAAIPGHYSRCSKIVSGNGPVIHSPAAGAAYQIRPGVDLKYQKILLDASVSNQTKKIYWFMNRRLIFSGQPTAKVFITPAPGKHTLICMDDEGRASEVELVIN